MSVDVIIPENVVTASGMSPEQLRVEIAVYLFGGKRLTLGQAASLAEMSQPDFQHLLGRRKIPLHYGVQEFEEDLKTLEEFRGK
jgi:predicted HTH domain antitoxin